MSAGVCMCPDDCGCHYPWRPTLCGRRGHEAGSEHHDPSSHLNRAGHRGRGRITRRVS